MDNKAAFCIQMDGEKEGRVSHSYDSIDGAPNDNQSDGQNFFMPTTRASYVGDGVGQNGLELAAH